MIFIVNSQIDKQLKRNVKLTWKSLTTCIQPTE